MTLYVIFMSITLIIPRFLLESMNRRKYIQRRLKLIKKLQQLDKQSSLSNPVLKQLYIDASHFLGANLVRFCDLVDTPHLYWPLWVAGMWITCGPMFFGNFCPSANEFGKRFGLFFPYGIRYFVYICLFEIFL